MAVKTVLFDFDGTLADTLPVSFQAFKTVFRKYDDRLLTDDQIVAMFGPTEEDILNKQLNNRASVAEAIEDYYEVYRASHTDVVPDNPEMIALLSDLKRRGIQIGVVTGKSDRSYQLSADILKLKRFVDVAITGDDVDKPKPDPEGVLKALKLLGASGEEAVFLGDSNARHQGRHSGRSSNIRRAMAVGVPEYEVRNGAGPGFSTDWRVCGVA